MNRWVNVDEHHGVPSQERQDLDPPPRWRLGAIAALGRPHDLVISADRSQVAFVLDLDDLSDIWAVHVDGSGLRRLTTGRAPHAFWEDTPPAWSPDGNRVAYAEGGWVHVVPAAGGPPEAIVEAGAPRWLDDETLLVIVDRDGTSRLCSAAVADPWPVALTPADGSVWALDLAPDRSRLVYVSSPRDDRTRSDLRVLDLTSGEVTTPVSNPGFFVASPAFSPDGTRIVYSSEQSGWSELWLLEDGEPRRLTSDLAGFSSPRWREDGSAIVAVRTRAGVSDLVAVDPQSGSVEVLAPGGAWSSPHLLAGGGIIALHEDHRTAPTVAMLSAAGEHSTVFSAVPAAIGAAPHVSPQAVTYPSLDGLEIPGFLFRPPAADHGRCPVVVYPHGGPTSHYGDEWDGHAQYFLDKGYGWFAINFRGSTSYGLDFEHAEHGKWGVADTDDCLAAYDYLVTLDWVDPDRVAIFGASYGSYLAVASLARDPQHRYACGVAKYGDCDILTSWAQGDQVGVEDLERMMGHPSANKAAYVAGSPFHHLADIERPLLIAHGELDDRVHPKQSEQLVTALRALDKTFEYVTYPTEGHGLLRRGPQVHFYERLERFLDWHLI